MKFVGRTAVITGAASPIGRAIAAHFAEEGAGIVLADVDGDALDLAVAALDAKVIKIVSDLSKRSAAVDLLAQAKEGAGSVDILINNAGGGVIAPFLDHDEETMRTTIDRNLWTCVYCCHAALPVMISQNYGRIINIGADSVRNGLWAHAMYNAAKGGMHGLTTGLAREFAEYDITVNTVAPCMVRTPQVEAATEAGHPLIERFLSVIPKGRAGEPEEIASTVVHLAQQESAFITGQTFGVNGGSTMQ